MAVIQARKNKKGTTSQVLIRANDGHPPAYKNFSTKQEAKDWAKLEEARRLKETYFPDQAKKKYTLTELGHRYIEEVLPLKPKNAKDTKRHIEWWIKKMGKYSLSLISYDLIDKYRKELINTPTEHGGKRNPATVNRYMSSLLVKSIRKIIHILRLLTLSLQTVVLKRFSMNYYMKISQILTPENFLLISKLLILKWKVLHLLNNIFIMRCERVALI